jgi:hypothetical protein
VILAIVVLNAIVGFVQDYSHDSRDGWNWQPGR